MSKSISGWLTPSRQFVTCSLYAHIKVALENEELKTALGKWGLETVAEVKAVRAGCLELEIAEGSSNAEWHSWELVVDDATYELRNRLLSKGFLRVGTNGTTLHFEGSPGGVQNLFQAAKDFAEENGYGYIFEVV